MNALIGGENWQLESLHSNKEVVGCKWVFFIKYQLDGIIERLKARLITKDFP